jgi:mevalonate kinase
MDVKYILYNMVYVPTMHRYGDRDGHQYIMGVYTDLERATKAAIEEAERRGGKYEWNIYGYVLDRDRFESHEETKTRVVRKSKEMTGTTDEEHEETFRDPVKLKQAMQRAMQAQTKEKAEALNENIEYHQNCLKWLLEEKKEKDGREQVQKGS